MRSRTPATEAGRLAEYIRIKTAERVVTDTNWNGSDGTPQTICECWANVYPLRGDESWASLREANISAYSVEVRWMDIMNPSVTVTPTMRVHCDAGPVLEIEDIQHLDFARNRAVLRCKEIR